MTHVVAKLSTGADLDSAVEAARRALLVARKAVAAEIGAYPTPISGCDAQFNHLLAERQKISAALTALDEPVFVPTPRTPAPEAGVESR